MVTDNHARVLTTTLSRRFPMGKGTRQGDSLSPTTYVLVHQLVLLYVQDKMIGYSTERRKRWNAPTEPPHGTFSWPPIQVWWRCDQANWLCPPNPSSTLWSLTHRWKDWVDTAVVGEWRPGVSGAPRHRWIHHDSNSMVRPADVPGKEGHGGTFPVPRHTWGDQTFQATNVYQSRTVLEEVMHSHHKWQVVCNQNARLPHPATGCPSCSMMESTPGSPFNILKIDSSTVCFSIVLSFRCCECEYIVPWLYQLGVDPIAIVMGLRSNCEENCLQLLAQPTPFIESLVFPFLNRTVCRFARTVIITSRPDRTIFSANWVLV